MNDQLDLYLDGMLDPAAHAAFEQRLRTDPALREQAALQGRIDTDLRDELAYQRQSALRLAAPTGTQPALPPLPRPAHASGAARAWPRQVFALAAVLALGALAIWFNLSPPAQPRDIEDLPPDTAYARLVAAGFTPQFVCTTDEAFAKAVKDRFGQALLVAATPSVQLLGWAYDAGYRTRVLGNESLILMAKVGGSDTIVIMDKLTNDRSMPAPTAPGLYMHRRVVGSMVVYEVSRSPSPVIADKVYDPDAGK
ncbi:MAG: anti-sigma factor family protein [Phycisphaerales bacterium]